MTTRARSILLGLVAALLVAGCGVDDTPPVALTFSTPRALTVGCATPPSDLAAELWISGNRDSCPLEVDVAAGTTTGSCETTAGLVRTVTLDWFVFRPSPSSTSTRVLLAQARDQVDLREEPEGDVALTFAEEDIVVRGCLDVREDPAEGRATQRVDGVDREVCDLDGDCPDADDVACSNVSELCAGADPLAP